MSVPTADEQDLSARGVKVMLVEDHQLLAQSLQIALEAEGLAVLTASLTSAEDVLKTAMRFKPDVVLLDLDLPEPIVDGSSLIPPLSDGGSQVVVVSGTNDRLRLAHCLQLGAAGFLSKNAPIETLLAAVLDISSLQALLSPNERLDLLAELRAQRAEERERLALFAHLTPKERRALRAMMDGLPAERMAQEWFVSEATVRSQIRAVLTKLGVNSQLAAVAAARRARWEG
jgi:DNA-binding NarL/FixJ family response regulator